ALHLFDRCQKLLFIRDQIFLDKEICCALAPLYHLAEYLQRVRIDLEPPGHPLAESDHPLHFIIQSIELEELPVGLRDFSAMVQRSRGPADPRGPHWGALVGKLGFEHIDAGFESLAVRELYIL